MACQRLGTKQFVEFFCGSGGLVAAAVELGLRTAWYDAQLGSARMDICTDEGFAMAIGLALSLCRGGVAWFGVPCSTFVWISRGHTKRSRRKPLGDESRRDVQDANVILLRVVLLLQVLALRQVFFVIEQPASSVLFRMPAFRALLRSRLCIGRHRLQKRFLWLGHFGHRFWKPSLLVGIFPGLRARRELSSRRPPPRIAKAWHKWKDAQGRVRCAGTMNLKATEHYPARFCHCMVRLVSEVVRSPCTIPHGLGKLSKPVATVD